MLCLSRKKNQSVVIAVPPSVTETVVKVMVTEIRGDKARLGCTAPVAVVIHRQEVYEAIKRHHGPGTSEATT